MTRNTRFYNVKPEINGKKTQVIFRDLNVLELSCLKNVNNLAIRTEMAANFSIINISPDKVPWPIKQQIGEKVISKSFECATDKELRELTIEEFRTKGAQSDPFLADVIVILQHFPGQSFTDLLKLTHRDLIELVVTLEEITGKTIYGSNTRKGRHLVNPKDLPDGGKSLQQEIDKLSARSGIPQ